MEKLEQRIYLALVGCIIVSLPFSLELNSHSLAYQHCMAIVVFCVTVLICIVLCRRYKYSLVVTWGDLFVALYVVYGGCQFFVYWEELPASLFSSWTIVVAIYLLSRNLPTRLMFLFLGVACLLQAFVALCQSVGVLSGSHSFFKVAGSFWNPSQLGGFIACFFPLLAVEIWDGKHAFRFVWLLLPLIVALVLSDSRAAWLACVVGTLYAFRLVPRTRKQVGLVVICAAFLLTGLYIYKPLSALGRLHLWKIATGMVFEAPLFGTGIHSFPGLYMLRQAHYFESHPNDSFADMATVVITPYNEFLHILVEQGIVGLILFILLCGSVFAQRHDNGNRKYTAVLLAFLVFACFSYPGENVALLAGLALCLGAYRGRVAFSVPLCRAMRLLPLIAMLVVVMINAGIWKNYRTLADGLHSPSGEIPLAAYRNEPEALQILLRRSGRLSLDEQRQVRGWIAARCPSPTTFCDLGYFLEKQGDVVSAEKYYRLAAHMVPNQVRANYYLFKLYELNGYPAKAREMASHIVRQHVKIENSFTIGAQGEAERYLKKRDQLTNN